MRRIRSVLFWDRLLIVDGRHQQQSCHCVSTCPRPHHAKSELKPPTAASESVLTRSHRDGRKFCLLFPSHHFIAICSQPLPKSLSLYPYRDTTTRPSAAVSNLQHRLAAAPGVKIHLKKYLADDAMSFVCVHVIPFFPTLSMLTLLNTMLNLSLVNRILWKQRGRGIDWR